MIANAAEDEVPPEYRGYALDHTDGNLGRIEDRPLLDVELEIGCDLLGLALRLEDSARV